MISNSILWADCLEVLPDIPDGSIDMILVDPPYGSTRAAWDQVLPMAEFWRQHMRVIKDNGAVIVTANQPFASHLIVSNERYFKYDLIWKKNKSTNFLNAKRMPLRCHEYVLVFYKKPPTYHPQKTFGHKPVNSHTKKPYGGDVYGNTNKTYKGGGQTDRHPLSIQSFPIVNNDSAERVHISQKPVELFAWLIRSYSNEGAVILDSCAGSCTTAIAAMQENRQFICIESDYDMYRKARDRVVRYKNAVSNK